MKRSFWRDCFSRKEKYVVDMRLDDDLEFEKTVELQVRMPYRGETGFLGEGAAVPAVTAPIIGISKAGEALENIESVTLCTYPNIEAVEIGTSSIVGTRSYQQDAVRTAVFDRDETSRVQRVIGVLCDGMGGLEGGEYASNRVADRMIELFRSTTQNYAQFFGQAVQSLNKEVTELCDDKGRKLQAGTTLTCTALDGNNMYWCSVGDSRIYLCRNGQIVQLSKDHNYGTTTDALLEMGIISIKDVNPLQKREALTSYLGMEKVRQVGGNETPIILQPGDTIIQCSDGLYRALSSQDLLEILRQVPDVASAAEAMTSMAVAIPGAHDNISVVLIRYKGNVEKNESFT